jgi:hypothetical protein
MRKRWFYISCAFVWARQQLALQSDHVLFYGPLIFLLYGSRRGSTWPRGYTPCWQVYTDKTRVMPFIPTKSLHAWPRHGSWATFIQLSHARAKSENPDRKHRPSRIAGRGADNPTLEKTLVMKSEEAIAGYFSWQKLLRKTRAHIGLSSRWWWFLLYSDDIWCGVLPLEAARNKWYE